MANDLHTAVLKLQSEIGTLQKNAINPHFKSRYISLENLVEAVQPLLTKHGLIWHCYPSHYDGSPVLVYTLTHAESGEGMGAEMPLLLDKQNAQGLGSAITYARRYALCAVLNIVADVDDDGNKASTKTTQIDATPDERSAKGTGASEANASSDFASQLRATKMKATDIKAWLQTEGGHNKQVAELSGLTLAKFLNDLNEQEQGKLLAWANG
jgi:hypothetical protein